ncbi:hypothetical protein IL38_23805 [Actinopolyspora erythraea]|uniref:ParB/Sulfiredoxin domain-containing protein n=2 Tax=Actinopolyspora erythraea TaxID=414996 RepID=A0ABR4WY74_9ACTN|nr:hypothetical protein IL38_23805 [Actinopolyspora erythraea]
MVFRRETITPERAAMDLENRARNRSIANASVQALVRSIQAGRWEPDNGETVKYNVDGQLTDGQHRFQAVITTQTPVEMNIAYNVPDEAMGTIDAGRARSTSDNLSIRHGSGTETMPKASVVASVHKRVFAWMNAQYLNLGSIKFTADDIDVTSTTHQEVIEAVRFILDNKTTLTRHLLTEAQAGMAAWLLRKCSVPDAEVFFERLNSGIPVGEHDPVFRLREALIRAPGRGTRRAEHVNLYVIIQAWNHFRKGNELKLMRMPRAEQEFTWDKFPRPI